MASLWVSCWVRRLLLESHRLLVIMMAYGLGKHLRRLLAFKHVVVPFKVIEIIVRKMSEVLLRDFDNILLCHIASSHH